MSETRSNYTSKEHIEPLPAQSLTVERHLSDEDYLDPEPGQIVAHGITFWGECFRCVLEITEDHHYLVQEFSAKQGEKRSDPYVITNKKAVYQDTFDFWQEKEAPVEGAYVLWSSPTQKCLQGQFKNGKKHGRWKYWSVDGQKIAEENYHNGLLEGPWRRWSYGIKCQEGQFSKDKKTGFWTQWWFNGQVCAQGNYHSGVPHGEWQWWRRDGIRLVQGLYNHGQKVGTWLRWNRNGKLMGRKSYANETYDPIQWVKNKFNIDIDQKKTQEQVLLLRERVNLSNLYDNQNINYSREFLGVTPDGHYVVRDFYTVGDEKFTDPYILLDYDAIFRKEFDFWSPSWRIEGTYTQWHENGQQSLQMQFKAGMRHGVQTNWDDAGHKITEKHFYENDLNGFYYIWYPNGQLHEKQYYFHNVRAGLWVTWWENGEKKYQGTYQDGLLNGRWNWWHSNGVDKAQGQYHQGHKYGIWEWWDESRELLERKDFGTKDKNIAQWLREMYNIRLAPEQEQSAYNSSPPIGDRFEIYDIDFLNTYDRVYLGTTQEGFDVVQDFYWEEGDRYRTTPYMIQDRNRSALLYHEVDDVQRCGIEGAYLQWYSTGNMEFKAHMKSGKPVGLWQWWNNSKELIKSINYGE